MAIGRDSLWLWHRAQDLLFPPQCVVCGRLERWLCPECLKHIPLLDAPLCQRCGRLWTEEGLCPSCQEHPLSLEKIRAAVLFAPGPVQEVLHALKYRGAIDLALPLSALLLQAWEKYAYASDWLIPVPLHPRRERKRGYNQAALLALALGARLQLPVAPRALQRVRHTVSQTHLNREERRKNVAEAFALAPGLDVSGLRITLIDDVATTGATLDACAGVLLAGGAREVTALTVARAS